MKAKVQYNDFIGTSAADGSDHTSLIDFLKSRGVDVSRYIPIGASFYTGYNSFFSASIICLDNTKSTDNKKHIVSIDFEDDLGKDEFFNLFKRLNVMFVKYGEHSDKEIDENITL